MLYEVITNLLGQDSAQRSCDRNFVSMDSPSPVSVSRDRRIGLALVLAAFFYSGAIRQYVICLLPAGSARNNFV